ncbi:MAG: thiamine pyrophosphate-dependent enzyme, partial [Gemmatimonadota bacterium]
VQTALTPPTGPVFLSLPVDLQREEIGEADLSPPRLADSRVRPSGESLRRAAEVLLAARRPALLAGGGAAESGAAPELERLAEILGAAVLTESTASQGRRPIAADHPLYAGPIPMWAPDVAARLSEHDVVLAVGADLFRLYIHREPASPLPRDLRLIHLDADARAIGRSFPMELGLVGDPKAGLAELAELVEASLTPAQRRDAAARVEAGRARQAAARAQLDRERTAQADQRPMVLLPFTEALCRHLPPKAAVVEEAITTHHRLLERLGVPADPTGYFAHRGWALGWGLGCAIGVKLAWPERPVVALLGDGSALFGIQGLWTAARYRVPVTFVIVNNAQYGILKMGGRVMGLPRMSAGQHVGIDLTDPEVDFVGLARALGVPAARVEEPGELAERVRAGVEGDGPVLLDVAVER